MNKQQYAPITWAELDSILVALQNAKSRVEDLVKVAYPDNKGKRLEASNELLAYLQENIALLERLFRRATTGRRSLAEVAQDIERLNVFSDSEMRHVHSLKLCTDPEDEGAREHGRALVTLLGDRKEDQARALRDELCAILRATKKLTDVT